VRALRCPVTDAANGLLAFIGLFTGPFGYLGIALVTVAVAPELVMPLAGFLVARGDLDFALVLLAGAVGGMLGQGGIYWAARAVGEARVRGFFRRYGRLLLLRERDLDAALGLFERFERSMLLFGRAVPTVRSLISIPAGIKALPFGRFLLLSALGTGLWNALLLFAGTLVGRNWGQLVAFLESYQTLILIVLGASVLAFSLRRVRAQLAHSQSR
jgi:membrane protein DedA with SNARE-associated domain